MLFFPLRICLVGERLMIPPDNMTGFTWDSWCSKNASGDLAHRYCEMINGSSVCDPYYEQSDIQWIPGIPGMASGIISGKGSSGWVGLNRACHPDGQAKSLSFIWRSGTRRWNLRVPDLQMNCRDLTTWQGTRIVAPRMVARWHALLTLWSLNKMDVILHTFSNAFSYMKIIASFIKMLLKFVP